MLNIFKRSDKKPETEKPSKLARLKQGLSRTRTQITDGVANSVLGKQIDDALLEELETQLLLADVGVETTQSILDDLTARVARKELKDGDALINALKQHLSALLNKHASPLSIEKQNDPPFVILMVGINGVGKTTTIGKLAKQFQTQGHSVLLAAGDTFRAAAVEQLQIWGKRNDIPVIAQKTDADSAAVIFDALQAAKARHIDIVIADTAGRLHTQKHLMAELQKIQRVIKKFDASAPHEVMLVLDAGTGQNALQQAKQFGQAIALTGLTLTKLDGTAKGGIVFALVKQTQLPIRYVGIGEGIDDLQAFDANTFVDVLFGETNEAL